MTTHRYSRLALVSFTVVLAFGCGSSSDVVVDDDASMRSTADSTASTTTMLMHDTDIAGIVLTANQGEVDLGQLARSMATSAEVRRFAEMMVTGHLEAIQTRQADVEQDGLRLEQGGDFQRRRPIVRDLDVMSPQAQEEGHALRRVHVVVDHQDTAHHEAVRRGRLSGH